MEAILSNSRLLESLEQIEMFSGISRDLSATITANKELSKKKLEKVKLSEEEKSNKEEASKRRDAIREKLQHLVTRLPAFMYLTDNRERTIRDIIQQLEPSLFEKVTGISVTDFGELVDAGVFDDNKMEDAVWKFRTFEEPSLRY
jgi:hypothetical protein